MVSQVLVLLVLAAASAPAAPFRDVPRDHWAAEDAAWLHDEGMIEGWEGKLHGSREFTRYEMVKVLARYLRRAEGVRAELEQRLDRLESNDRRQDAQLARLFDSGAETGLNPPPDLLEATEAARREAEGMAADPGDGAGVLPSGDAERGSGSPAQLRMSARMAVIRSRLRSVRSEGLTSPMLVVPPGSVAEVSLPGVLLDSRPARLGEGAHMLQWESHVVVPRGSSASVLYPGTTGGYVLMEETKAVARRAGLDRLQGEVLPVAKGGSLPRVLD